MTGNNSMTRNGSMAENDSTYLLRARGLTKQYGRDAGLVRAVDGVDLDVARAETVAIMGIPAAPVAQSLGAAARATGFAPKLSVVEITGTCAHCQKAA